MDTPRLGSVDGSRDLAAGDWRRHWRLSCWGIERTVLATLETQRLGSGEDSGDLAVGDWRRQWRLSSWEFKATLGT